MIKKLIPLFLFIIFSLPASADYTPIPPQYSRQYKAEINQVIKKEIPISKTAVNKIFLEAAEEQDFYIQRVIIEQGINSIIFEFYMKLINVTDKYTNISQSLPPSDWYGDLQTIITPYLKDNNADISKINSFLNYAAEKQLELEQKYK